MGDALLAAHHSDALLLLVGATSSLSTFPPRSSRPAEPPVIRSTTPVVWYETSIGRNHGQPQ